MDELAYHVASLVILALSALWRPDHAQCPAHWWMEGVRPTGAFDCRRVPIGDDTWDAKHGERDHSYQPPGVIYGRIYCRAGMRPSAIDFERVVCVRAR